MMRLGKKTGFNRTGPVQFELVFGPVRLIFSKINVIRFGWFFESKPNRTVNTPISNKGGKGEVKVKKYCHFSYFLIYIYIYIHTHTHTHPHTLIYMNKK
jgi:hypothetical protein